MTIIGSYATGAAAITWPNLPQEDCLQTHTFIQNVDDSSTTQFNLTNFANGANVNFLEKYIKVQGQKQY